MIMGNDLGMQYIMDGSGNYYKINSKNQLVVADGMEDATQFTFLMLIRELVVEKVQIFRKGGYFIWVYILM